jgi:hypothetical protein
MRSTAVLAVASALAQLQRRHLHIRFSAEQDSSACDWASPGNLSQYLEAHFSQDRLQPIARAADYRKPLTIEELAIAGSPFPVSKV